MAIISSQKLRSEQMPQTTAGLGTGSLSELCSFLESRSHTGKEEPDEHGSLCFPVLFLLMQVDTCLFTVLTSGYCRVLFIEAVR